MIRQDDKTNENTLKKKKSIFSPQTNIHIYLCK